MLSLEAVMASISKMFNPPHPGATLRDNVLPALGLSVTAAAKQLGVTRAALSRVLNEHAAISPMMALRLEAWLGIENGGSAEVWIAHQASYDLWQARKLGVPGIRKIKLLAP
jgi:addiction module HigA family antidote